jgi:hypothetical protein
MPQNQDFVNRVHPNTLCMMANECLLAGYSHFRLGTMGIGEAPNVQFETEDGSRKLTVNSRRFRPFRRVKVFNPNNLSRRLCAADYASPQPRLSPPAPE